jgi:hypothetical protein
VEFTDQSTNDPTSWSWDFGDEGTSAEQNPTHIYETAGTYTVTLTVSNAGGEGTEIKVDYITVTGGSALGEANSLVLSRPTPLGAEGGRISCFLPEEGYVSLELFGLDGRREAVLLEGYRSSGWQLVNWDPRGHAKGYHFLRLTWKDLLLTKKVLLVN